MFTPANARSSQEIEVGLLGWVSEADSFLTTSPSLRAKRSNPVFPFAANKMDCRVALLPCTNALRLLQAMTLIGLNTTSHSRGALRPKFCNQPHPRNQRAQGRPGARRTRGLMGDMGSKCCPRAYRFGGNTPAFPAQWLYGLYEIVLVTLLFVTPSPARSFHLSPT
jgi:hypothetical protein